MLLQVQTGSLTDEIFAASGESPFEYGWHPLHLYRRRIVVLSIGYQYFQTESQKYRSISFFLILDPSLSSATVVQKSAEVHFVVRLEVISVAKNFGFFRVPLSMLFLLFSHNC